MAEFAPARDPFRWTILALITVSHIIGAAAQYGINTLAPFYQEELGLTRAQVGLFFSAFYLAMTGASFFTGWLADRNGVRKTSLQGHLLLGICTIAASLSPSFEWGCVSFFLAGLGYSFLNPASTIGVMSWFTREERATAMGAKQTGVPAGGVVAAILAPSLVLLIGWRGALAALGLINFLFGFLFFSLWREPASGAEAGGAAKHAAAEDSTPLNVWGLLPVSCATAIYLIGQMVLITYVPLYLKDAMGYSAYWASQALALTQAGAVVGRVGWGVASDRLFGGRRKIVLLVIGILSVNLIGALGFMNQDSPMILLMAILFLAGVCIVGYQGVSYALIGEIAGKAKTGAGLGMMIAINAGAATVGTPVFGHIVDRTGSYATGWQLLAAAISVGIIGMAVLLKEPRRESAGETSTQRREEI
ncbi:MAG TPA: MFS transporter [Verrucomicrobiae bacterium]|jgi:MFS transporter, ACS family, hexuronate transporter|nr:MFS transporter [Verrucomicrobiae bacterium]